MILKQKMNVTKRFIAHIVFTTVIIVMYVTNGKAQYSDLFDFTDTASGKFPTGSLMQASDGMLYGLTSYGGTNDGGVLFQYNPVTNTYTKKYDFSVIANGDSPHGSLIQANDGMLYGMTEKGGNYDKGVIFQYNPITNIYAKKIDFDGTDGKGPDGSLMQASDGMLYGMTTNGGVNDYGTLFQYNPTINTYTKKYDFDGGANGGLPIYSSLIQAGDGLLYGMTHKGGTSNMGVIFQYNFVTVTLIKKIDFNTTNGEWPYNSLMQANDGMLYGVTTAGGENLIGVIFQYNPTTNTFTKKYDFDGTNGYIPYCNLIQGTSGLLYGIAAFGGSLYGGVIFQYNISSNSYTNLKSLDTISGGCDPLGSLIQANDEVLYGLASVGGANHVGAIFSYNVSTGIKENNSELSFNICPNPFNSETKIVFSEEQKNTIITITDIVGKKITFSTFSGTQFTIEKVNMKNGIYILHVKANGKPIVNRKIIVQ